MNQVSDISVSFNKQKKTLAMSMRSNNHSNLYPKHQFRQQSSLSKTKLKPYRNSLFIGVDYSVVLHDNNNYLKSHTVNVRVSRPFYSCHARSIIFHNFQINKKKKPSMVEFIMPNFVNP